MSIQIHASRLSWTNVRVAAVLIATCTPLLLARAAGAASHVRVAGDSIRQGFSGEIEIYLSNDSRLTSFSLPLVARSSGGGAFWTDVDTLPWLLRPPDWTSYHYFVRDSVDLTTPDQFLLLALDNIWGMMEPGTDPPGSPGIRLAISVNQSVGTVEIDTALYPPAFRLVFDSFGQAILPTFEKGTVTIIDCGTCPAQGDVAPIATQGDGVIDLLDVAALIDYVFRSGATPPHDATCPRSRGDINGAVGDDVVNVLDVVYEIDHAFRSGPPPSDPCNP